MMIQACYGGDLFGESSLAQKWAAMRLATTDMFFQISYKN